MTATGFPHRTGSPWVLTDGTSINDAGTIVGAGIIGGAYHAFILTPAGTAGTISGAVFNDLNANRTQQSTEKGVAGWQVFIDSNKNGLLDSNEIVVKTDSTGKFQIKNLAAGTYVIRVKILTGHKQTLPASNGALTVVLTAGLAKVGLLFGVK